MLSLSEFKTQIKEQHLSTWPFAPRIEFLWSFELKAAAKDLWPYLADTSRLNREMGFGARTQVEQDGKLLVETKMLGLDQVWIEEPWTWVENRVITCTRVYQKGFAKKMHSIFLLEELPGDRRQVYVYFGWEPKNRFWAGFLRLTSSLLEKKFAAAFTKIDHALGLVRPVKALSASAPPLPEPVKIKLEDVRRDLNSRNFAPALTDRFLNHLVSADEFDVEPVRLIPLARSWDIPLNQLLSLSLHSVRSGLLKISWDVICPHCRGSRFSAESLSSIPAAANCDVCEIDFTTADDNSIEVLFHVHPAIRKIEAMQFCAAEPAKKSHIRVQHYNPRHLNLRLAAGTYRARAIGQNWLTEIDVNAQHGASTAHVGEASAKVEVGCDFTLNYEGSAMVVVEELKWQTDALKPGDVIAMSEFRDIFAKEHLNSNVKLFLGTQTLLFTDIVGSTNFYSKSGDAKAFAEVREHFREVFDIVHAHQGAVVKTIGDAVMASFTNTEAALSAAVQIQKQFHSLREDLSIRLRISIHSGPVIAVDLNTGLDYFGNTVNLAAKIQTCAGAGEIALSEVVYAAYTKMNWSFPMVLRQNSRDGAAKTDVYVLQVTAPVAKAA